MRSFAEASDRGVVGVGTGVGLGARRSVGRLRGRTVGRVGVVSRGRVRVNLGDTMYERIGVADLGGRILKWAKTDEKL